MRLKMSLARPGGAVEDLLVTVDAVATVGDLAGALALSDPTADPASTPGPLTLRRHGDGATASAQLLDAELSVGDAGLRSGVTVSLAPRGQSSSDGPAGPAAAVLTVLAGPGTGRRVDLPVGSTYVGREHGCDVRLDDPMVSKRHARITVADVVEVVDLGSANGVSVDGGLVQRAVLRNGDTVVLGDTTLSVTLLERSIVAAAGGSSAVAFNRSPRVLRPFLGEEVAAPDPPGRPQEQRLPFLALIAPLLLGAVLYAVTRSVLTLAFVGLSPLLMIGTFVDARRAGRRTARAEAAVFTEAVTAVDEQLGALRVLEREIRLAETPSTSDVAAAVGGLSTLLWSRRPDLPGFMTLRLGDGTQPSRSSVRLPTSNSTTREHWAVLQDLAQRYAEVVDVPVVVDLQEAGAVGVAGRTEAALAVARGLVLQLAGLHSPAELVVTGLASTATAPVWEWLKWLPHVGSAHSPLTGSHLASSPAGAAVLLTQLEELVEQRVADGAGARPEDALPLPAVLVACTTTVRPSAAAWCSWPRVDIQRAFSCCGSLLQSIACRQPAASSSTSARPSRVPSPATSRRAPWCDRSAASSCLLSTHWPPRAGWPRWMMRGPGSTTAATCPARCPSSDCWGPSTPPAPKRCWSGGGPTPRSTRATDASRSAAARTGPCAPWSARARPVPAT